MSGAIPLLPPCVAMAYTGKEFYLVPSKLIFKRRLQILVLTPFYSELLLTQLSIIQAYIHVGY